jgi:hypothetical protein
MISRDYVSTFELGPFSANRGRSLNPPFHLFIYLFKTILIGLNYLLSYFMSGQKEDIFIFGTIPVFGAQIPLRNLTALVLVDNSTSTR